MYIRTHSFTTPPSHHQPLDLTLSPSSLTPLIPYSISRHLSSTSPGECWVITSLPRVYVTRRTRRIRHPDEDGLLNIETTQSFERSVHRTPTVSWNGIVQAQLQDALLFNLTGRYPQWVEPCPTSHGCCNPWHKALRPSIGEMDFARARQHPNWHQKIQHQTNGGRLPKADEPQVRLPPIAALRRLKIRKPPTFKEKVQPVTPFGKSGRPSKAERLARENFVPIAPSLADPDLVALMELHLEVGRSKEEAMQLLRLDGYTPEAIDLALPSKWRHSP